MNKKEIEKYCPKSRSDWRNWLENHHQTKQSVWLIFYRVSTKIPSLSWSEAVDEALCFGWIDSTKKTIDNERYMQYFTRRKPKSNWSRINKEKVEVLIKNRLMTQAGIKAIEIAKDNGSWTILDDVENLVVPKDLKIALSKNTSSKEFFESQSKSKQKILLYWIVSAKRIETRNKRIAEIVRSAALNKRPKQFE